MFLTNFRRSYLKGNPYVFYIWWLPPPGEEHAPPAPSHFIFAGSAELLDAFAYACCNLIMKSFFFFTPFPKDTSNFEACFSHASKLSIDFPEGDLIYQLDPHNSVVSGVELSLLCGLSLVT